MSGSGRKTGYRKSIARQFLYEDREPSENEVVVQVVGLRGSNLFEVLCSDGSTSLALLPQKFRKLIWIKRGCFLIVSSATDDVTTALGKKGAVTFMIEHILSNDQVKSLKAKGEWPNCFSELNEVSTNCDIDIQEKNRVNELQKSLNSLYVQPKLNSDYESSDDDESDLYVNNNRLGARINDDSCDDDSD